MVPSFVTSYSDSVTENVGCDILTEPDAFVIFNEAVSTVVVPVATSVPVHEPPPSFDHEPESAVCTSDRYTLILTVVEVSNAEISM